MKYIQKGNEPPEFTQWKEQQKPLGVKYCNYEYLQNPEKRLTHEALLREQGYICCYCCQRIDKKTSHIEHLEPQSKTEVELSVDYANLLTSCGRDGNWPNHCGHKRGNKPIPVSPLLGNCEAFFRYSGGGEILPTNASDKKAAAETTIDILGLNAYDLKKMRIEAIDVWIGMTEEEAQLVAQDFQQQDPEGKYQPFCMAVLYYLKEYYGF